MASYIRTSFRNPVLFLLFLTSSLLCHHGFALNTNQHYWYITPNPNTPCPAEPCLTLTQFAQEIQSNLASNTTLILLPGDHNLTSDIEISNVNQFAIHGISTVQKSAVVNSRIVCTSPASITFESISELAISCVDIVSCGARSTYCAFHVNSVQYFELSNVTLRNSQANVSFTVRDSNGLLRGTQFIGNFGVGMKATNSTVTFQGWHTFLGNFDGGVVSLDSTLNFGESIMFVNNTAGNGGGISAERSIINCRYKGYLIFMGNSAHLDGGGIYAYNTTINCDGQINLKGNTARRSGGGIFAYLSTVQYTGETYFEFNMAIEGGGGIQAENATVNISGESGFIGNKAEYGGGIHAENATVNISGESGFIDNTAEYGGGIHAQDGSAVNINGESNFKSNSARSFGGGIDVIFDSTLNIIGKSNFIDNTAKYGGGIHAQDGSAVNINGESNFRSNSAQSIGGGITVRYASSMNISGESNFIENTAEIGGGIYAQEDSAVNINGESIFKNNSAQFGGGINVRKGSSVNISGESNLIENTADNGGGIYVREDSAVNINGETRFKNNSAQSFGGGIEAISDSTVNIIGKSNFTDNTAESGGGICAQDGSVVNINGESSFKNNSAKFGGGIQLSAAGSVVNIIGKSNFWNNSGTFGGGIEAVSGSTVDISGESYFIDNTAEYAGGGIFTQDGSAVNINGESSFRNNSAQFGGGIHVRNGSSVNISGESNLIENTADNGGGIYVREDSAVNINGDISFRNNSGKFGGGIDATGSRVNISGTCNFTENRSRYGGGMYMDYGKLTLSGTTSFVNNSASYGGAIYAFVDNIFFSGNGNLIGNSASVSGGALSLVGNSKCLFAFDSFFYFTRNQAAQFGGAIYVEDAIGYCDLKRLVQDSFIGLDCSKQYTLPSGWGSQQSDLCLFKYTGNHTLSPFYQKSLGPFLPFFQLTFKDNTAQVAGSALYGGDIDYSLTNLEIQIPSLLNNRLLAINNVRSGEMIDKVATIEQSESDTTTSIISSNPSQVCQCFADKPDCRIQVHPSEVSIYPGQTFPISLVAVGQRNGTVPAVIRSYFDSPGAEFGDFQETQLSNKTCTELHYTIFSNKETEQITLYAEGPCGDSGISLHIQVTLPDCPTGFMLSNSESKYICSKRLQRYTHSCNISDQTITRDSNDFWVGLGKEAVGLILHAHCPLVYCKSQTVTFHLNDSDSQCNYNRSGLLCGGCQTGLSNVFGSARCLQCSNQYLLLLIAFVLAGIGLVILLLSVKLTVAVGTINGLVFYANIIAVNQPLFFPSGETNILTVFIAWLNLDLGVQACFFDGMDTYMRTWLQFVFPGYVWALVGAIILLSHYSTWFPRRLGSNPVSVLATLFLLSYTKLLRTIITAFSFTFLEYPHASRVVWLYDGNIGFLHGKHIPLFLVAMLALVFLFIPYTLLLLLGQWIQAHSRKRAFSWISDYRVKSFLDAYQAPFKDKHRYCAGAGLVTRCFLFLVFAFNILGDPRVNLLAISFSMLGLSIMLRFSGSIYKEWYLDILDASFILNLGILAGGTFYVREAGGNQAALTYTSVGIAFATFCAVVVNHAQRQIRDSDLWKNTIIPKLRRREPVPTESDSDDEQEDDHEGRPAVPPTTTFIDLCELLLEDSN